jgi:hypothetical protein
MKYLIFVLNVGITIWAGVAGADLWLMILFVLFDLGLLIDALRSER